MDDFAQFLVLGLVLAAAVGTGAAFGAIAFFRGERYRRALIEQDARIAALEAALSMRPAADVAHEAAAAAPAPRSPAVVSPFPQPAPPSAPAAAPVPTPAAAAKVAALAPAMTAAPVPAAQPVAARASEPLIKPEVFRRPTTPPLQTAPAASAPTPMAVDKTVVAWVVGAAVTIGVIATLIAAYEAGYFNQVSQLLLGYLMAAAMIGAAEVLRGRQSSEPPTDWQARHAPAILAAAGVVCAYGITFVGYGRLGLLLPAPTLGLLGACALGAFGLSLRHGQALAWTGLVGGFGAPFLSGVIGASPPALFAYLFAIAAAAFALAKHRGWLALGWAAAALAVVWGVLWTFVFFLPSGATAASAYLAALVVLAIAFAWDDAGAAVTFSPGAEKRIPWSPRAWVGMAGLVAAAGALATLSLAAAGAGEAAVHGLIAAVGAACLAATLREGFAPVAVAVAGLALAALAAWPPIGTGADAQAFAAAAGAFGFVASVGGWLMIARNDAPGPGALIAALAPAGALLAAYLRLGEAIPQPYAWGALALILAAFNGFALDRISKAAGGAARAPGATAAFAAASAACAVMAGAFAFDNVRMAAGLAVLLVPLAWLDRRLDIPALRFAGVAIGAVTVALLSPIAIVRAPVEATPVLNTLAPTFLIAILSVWAGARLFALGPAGYLGRVTIFLRIALVALVLSFGFAEIRHLANAGRMDAPYGSLLEVGGHTAFLLAVSCLIAWRYGREDRPLLHWTEMLCFAVALAHTVIAGLGLFAPWWGYAPSPAPGPLLANPLAVAYLAPALLFALYAWLRARIGPSVRAHAAGGAALVTGVAWLLLETRHAFHPTAMANAPVTPLEHATYSLALVVAGGVALLAALRLVGGLGGLMLRLAAAALTAAGFIKALAIDVPLIEGPVRYAVYALVAAAAVGALLGYYRYVFPQAPRPAPAPSQSAGAPDGNLLPPTP